MKPIKFWTYQELAQVIECHPRTVQRWIRRLNLRIFHPSQNTVRVPDAEAQKLLNATVRYSQAQFPYMNR
jgi:predicted site-specific integrase-resolvase